MAFRKHHCPEQTYLILWRVWGYQRRNQNP